MNDYKELLDNLRAYNRDYSQQAVKDIVTLMKRVDELEKENECLVEQIALHKESQIHKDMQELMRINNELLARIEELEGSEERGYHG